MREHETPRDTARREEESEEQGGRGWGAGNRATGSRLRVRRGGWTGSGRDSGGWSPTRLTPPPRPPLCRCAWSSPNLKPHAGLGGRGPRGRQVRRAVGFPPGDALSKWLSAGRGQKPPSGTQRGYLQQRGC